MVGALPASYTQSIFLFNAGLAKRKPVRGELVEP
jgi:hypothetical protein